MLRLTFEYNHYLFILLFLKINLITLINALSLSPFDILLAITEKTIDGSAFSEPARCVYYKSFRTWIYLWLMLCKVITKIMIRNMNAIRMKTQDKKLVAANNDTVLIVNRSSSGG
jgi:hypothetical protein